MQEIWKTVITPEGVYENYKVSNLGRIKSLNYNKTGKEKLLSLCKDKNGYLYINLCKNGVRKIYRLHRLVAYVFIPNIMNYNCIDHKDTNKENNAISNLVWVTQKQNCNNGLTRMKNSETKKGKHHSEETRKKMSESKKGEKNSFYGKHHTEESKKKMSKTHTGKILSEEHKKNISKAMKGKTMQVLFYN